MIAPWTCRLALARLRRASVAPALARSADSCWIAALMVVIAFYVAINAIRLGGLTAGQTTGSGLPLELTFYPMGIGATCMTVFALDQFLRRAVRDIVIALAIVAALAALWLAWNALSPATVPGAAQSKTPASGGTPGSLSA